MAVDSGVVERLEAQGMGLSALGLVMSKGMKGSKSDRKRARAREREHESEQER